MPNPYGQKIRDTQCNGLNMSEMWTRLFEWNETAWDRNTRAILSDDRIFELMIAAFPTRTWSKHLKNVPRQRAAYNRGCFARGVAPKRPSHKYELVDGRIYRLIPGKYRSELPSRRLLVGFLPVQLPHILRGLVPTRGQQLKTVPSEQSQTLVLA